MKLSSKSLIDYSIGAVDGEIGKVKEFYFDDLTWTIRYVIVETGNWLSGRKVLISPQALLAPDWANKILPVNLTQEQIKHSPDIDTDQPVSRQHERDLHAYYPWTSYWGDGVWSGGMGTSGMMMQVNEPFEEAIANNENKEKDTHKDTHLRSTQDVRGYGIKADDGEIGHVEDFIIDDKSWEIASMVVDTGNWFAGKKILLSPKSVKEINWEASSVFVTASVEQLKNSPEYDSTQPVDEI